MKIDQLQKELYSRDSKVEKRSLANDNYDPKRKFQQSSKKREFIEENKKENFPTKGNQINENENNQRDKEKSEEKPFFPSDIREDLIKIKEEEEKKAKEDPLKEKNKRKKIIVAIGVVVTTLIGGTILSFMFLKYSAGVYKEEKIELSIEGPGEVKSIEKSKYIIKITNNNKLDLEEGRLVISYSENLFLEEKSYLLKESIKSSRIDVGTIKEGATAIFEIEATPFGTRDSKIDLGVTFRYRPEGLSGFFEKKSNQTLIIKSSSLGLVVLPLTKTAASGETTELHLVIKNESEKKLENLLLKMEYPEGFSFSSSEPAPQKENRIWEIMGLEPGDQAKIILKGNLIGEPESVKIFKGELGKEQGGTFLVFVREEDSIKMVPSRMIIKQTANKEVVSAGEGIEFSVKFKNTSGFPLSDLILRTHLESRVLDEKKVLVKNGFYDSDKDEIIWKASELSKLKNLEPEEEGEANFSVWILDKLPMENENDKNFTIKTWSEIESLDFDSPLGQNKSIRSEQVELKVNSKAILSFSGYYNDGEFENSGPIPLEIGKETTFSIHFSLMNTSNDLKNVIVTALLPAGIVWKDKTASVKMGEYEFNSRTNELKWIVGNLDAGVGFISPVKTFSFQIGVIPSKNQLDGTNVKLLNELKLTALDTFTGVEIKQDLLESKIFSIADISDVKVEIKETSN